MYDPFVSVVGLVFGVDNIVSREPSLLNVRDRINGGQVVPVLLNQRIIPKDYRIVEGLFIVLYFSGRVDIRSAICTKGKQELYKSVVRGEKLLPGYPP